MLEVLVVRCFTPKPTDVRFHIFISLSSHAAIVMVTALAGGREVGHDQ
jgi:hypothetical protein